MSEERRANSNPLDVTGIVAIVYTIGFLTLAGLLYFFEIPSTNKDALLYLFGILSGIEGSIVAFFFGSSKGAEAIQRATEQRQGRAAAVVEEIAKSVPAAAAVAAGVAAGGVPAQPAVTPAPMNPETGVIPAAEVQPQENKP